jgi:PHP family Zn ribbon phosphoesterase
VADHQEIDGYPIIRSSDAHLPANIGNRFTEFYINESSFKEIRLALEGKKGRKIILE